MLPHLYVTWLDDLKTPPVRPNHHQSQFTISLGVGRLSKVFRWKNVFAKFRRSVVWVWKRMKHVSYHMKSLSGWQSDIKNFFWHRQHLGRQQLWVTKTSTKGLYGLVVYLSANVYLLCPQQRTYWPVLRICTKVCHQCTLKTKQDVSPCLSCSCVTY